MTLAQAFRVENLAGAIEWASRSGQNRFVRGFSRSLLSAADQLGVTDRLQRGALFRQTIGLLGGSAIGGGIGAVRGYGRDGTFGGAVAGGFRGAITGGVLGSSLVGIGTYRQLNGLVNNVRPPSGALGGM